MWDHWPGLEFEIFDGFSSPDRLAGSKTLAGSQAVESRENVQNFLFKHLSTINILFCHELANIAQEDHQTGKVVSPPPPPPPAAADVKMRPSIWAARVVSPWSAKRAKRSATQYDSIRVTGTWRVIKLMNSLFESLLCSDEWSSSSNDLSRLPRQQHERRVISERDKNHYYFMSENKCCPTAIVKNGGF